MARAACFSGIAAAAIWLIGVPLIAFSGVIPSDAGSFWFGATSALLGFALTPVTVAIARDRLTPMKVAVGGGGLAVCMALILSGVILVLAAEGRRAPTWVSGAADLAYVALFVWISLVSFALRGPSATERSVFWLGLITSASSLGSVLFSYVVPNFVYTNSTVLPFLLLGVLIWVSLPSWLLAVVIRLQLKAPGPGGGTELAPTRR